MKANTKYLLISFLAFVICSCGTPDASRRNVELIEKYIDAVEAKDPTAMSSFLSEDYYGIGPSVGDTINKAQAIDQWKENTESLYKEIEYTRNLNFPVIVEEGPNMGNWVTNFALVRIAYQSGDEVQMYANTSYMIENGKIKRTLTIYNEADVYEQLNYVFIDLDDLQDE